MVCPLVLTYPKLFDPVARPRVVAALLSAGSNGITQPADGDRWFQADVNEMVTRGWVVQHQMRVDRLWYYRLTVSGRDTADRLRREGWSFDGFDTWHNDTLMRIAA